MSIEVTLYDAKMETTRSRGDFEDDQWGAIAEIQSSIDDVKIDPKDLCRHMTARS